MPWYAFQELRGLNGKTTMKRWKLQATGMDGAGFTAALAAKNDIVGALNAITNATNQDSGVTWVNEGYNVGVGDLTEQALVNVWAEDPENEIDVLAISQVYVPAPNIGIFQGPSGAAMDIVDVNDANLQAYIDALSTHAYISDNEVIDVGTAVNGIENGKRVTRKSR